MWIFLYSRMRTNLLDQKLAPTIQIKKSLSAFESFKKTGALIISFVTYVFTTVGNFLSSASVDFSGPLEAGSFISKGISNSFSDYILIVSILSLSIGVLNLMPLPALDGGNFLIYLVEYIRGKPFSAEFLSILQKIGITFIFFVVMVVLLIDLKNNNGKSKYCENFTLITTTKINIKTTSPDIF